MNHTIGRHRRLYKLLQDTGAYKYRHEIIASYTDGVTYDSAQLSDLEVDQLCSVIEAMYVQERQADRPTRSGVDYSGQRQRRRILSLCYLIGWTVFDHNVGKHVVDYKRLNDWMLKRSHLHKPLNDYNRNELTLVVKQFEIMATVMLQSK